MKKAYGFLTPLILGIPFVLGLIPQSGDHPLILLPFLLLAATLILGNKLLELQTSDKMLFLLLGLWLVWGLSGILSPVPFPSKVTWIIFSSLPLSYMVARTTGSNLTRPMVASGAVLALYALYQSFEGGVSRPDAPFEDANLLGILMALCAVASLNNKTTLYALPLFLSALIVTESRTAFLALMAGMGVYFALSPMHWEKSKRLHFAVGTLAMAGLVLALSLYTNFDSRLTSTIDQSTGRLALWQSAWEMSWKNPLTGLGLGTFHLHYPPLRLAGDNSLGYMVHMEPLQSAVEAGWLSTLLLYGLFGFAGWHVWKNKAKNALPASLLAILFVSMHLTYPLHVVAFLIVMGFALSRIEKEEAHSDSPHPTSKIFSASILATLLCLTWVALGTVYTFLIWGEMRKAAHLHDQQRFDKALTSCINEGDPDFPDCRMMAARFIFLSGARDFEKSEKFLSEAERANPLNAEIPYLRAQSLFLKNPDSTQEVKAQLDKSLSLNPTYWPARKFMIDLLLSADKKPEARTYLEAGLIYPYPKSIRSDIEALRQRLDATN